MNDPRSDVDTFTVKPTVAVVGVIAVVVVAVVVVVVVVVAGVVVAGVVVAVVVVAVVVIVAVTVVFEIVAIISAVVEVPTTSGVEVIIACRNYCRNGHCCHC